MKQSEIKAENFSVLGALKPTEVRVNELTTRDAKNIFSWSDLLPENLVTLYSKRYGITPNISDNDAIRSAGIDINKVAPEDKATLVNKLYIERQNNLYKYLTSVHNITNTDGLLSMYPDMDTLKEALKQDLVGVVDLFSASQPLKKLAELLRTVKPIAILDPAPVDLFDNPTINAFTYYRVAGKENLCLLVDEASCQTALEIMGDEMVIETAAQALIRERDAGVEGINDILSFRGYLPAINQVYRGIMYTALDSLLANDPELDEALMPSHSESERMSALSKLADQVDGLRSGLGVLSERGA